MAHARVLLGTAMLLACGASPSSGGFSTAPVATAIGEQHAGDYNLGPVAFHGSFWNSCAPYPPEVEASIGDLLAGLALRFNGNGALCDTCVTIKTARGKSVTARVITTGETVGPNDVDLSQKAFDQVFDGEYPRRMTWSLVKCAPSNEKLRYQFQTEANPYWTSLWVRGARLPLKTVEVKKAAASTWTPLERGTDGTLTDASGFGEGKFTLRVTAYDGQVISDTFDRFTPGGILSSSSQFE
ncbi:MAG: hypothetical protein KIT84_07670 [Labilithrix sp.]|nr:hypothetical protein [Labilithrix sp.]MCW5810874.1 hypothetical protein [Labilithrix sp.]